MNYPVPRADATNSGANILARRPDPTVGAVLLLDSDQYSNYNSLQLTFALRQWHRVSLSGFYALASMILNVAEAPIPGGGPLPLPAVPAP